MDSRRWQSPAAAAAAAEAAEEDAGGTGGPSRRPARRGMNRSSPYGGGPRRWLARLPVASRIFPTATRDGSPAGDSPSLLSLLGASLLSADRCNNQEVHHESLDVIPELSLANVTMIDNFCELQRQSTEPNNNAAAAAPPVHMSNKFNLLLEVDKNSSHGDGLADIVNIIKQRHFTRQTIVDASVLFYVYRDETEHLIEIIRSRTPDLSVEDQRAPGSTVKGFETTLFSTPARLIDPQSSWSTDTLPSSNVHGVGSSPIEIAKAFMEAQTSASVHESQKRKFRALSHGVEVENSTPKIPKVATDSSLCWPGSVVRGYSNYLTPQSNKGRTRLQPLSRTPYSGSVFPRSVKNSGHGNTYNNSSGHSQLSTPFSVGNKTILEDKLASASGMVQPSSSSRGKVDVFGRASAVDDMSRGPSVSVHPKSSETAFKILQHLERTIPSPTLKPLELRKTLAKRNISSVATSSKGKGPDFSIGGHRQSGISESGTANLEIADAKKVPPSSPSADESSQKIQSSGANSEVPETRASQQPLKSDLTSTSAAEVTDKNTSKGFTFTFPIPKAPSSLLEPPPTPTLASPPRTLPVTTEDIPKFSFGSSSTANKLVFSFDSRGSSLGDDGSVPTFKFGSDKKRELCFDVAVKNAVC
ncbi:hypothetical protein HU200_058796 [Digitaria exilis]|uniref:Uncharacterized protein n=1 Tax=Digitaria exilis TaxID=1010633 RepID=A0A835DYX5_9POAL|nr:hypothetical protein HU200_058796 [Digitaria exilis]